MTEKQFQRIFEWAKKTPGRKKRILFLDKWLPWAVALIFACFSAICLFKGVPLDRLWLRPALCFVTVSLLRIVFDKERPYDRVGFRPLADFTPGKGKSFPSRHTACAFAIGFSVLKLSLLWGILCLAAAFLIGCLRVICGLHDPQDVFGGVLFAIVFEIF